MQRKGLAIFNLLGFLAMIAVNGLANALPINGKTTGEISDLYPNLFVPAGFTFSIWGVIYLALLGFIVFQLLSAWKTDHQGGIIDKIGYGFLVSAAANAGWIIAWHHEIIWLSLLIMLVLLATLVHIYRKLGVGVRPVSRSERYLVHAPFSLYLGWITIATIANCTALLIDLGWNGFGVDPIFWTILMLWAGVTITFRILQSRQDVIYTIPIIWAYFGIAMKRLAETSNITDTVCLGALLGITIVFLSALNFSFRRKKAAI